MGFLERVLAFVVKTQRIGTKKKNPSIAQKGLIWEDIKNEEGPPWQDLWVSTRLLQVRP